MVWRTTRAKSTKVNQRRRRLRFEPLEPLRMLSGVVNVFTQTVTGGPTVTAGDLWIEGDASEHSIEMVSATTAGLVDAFTITSVGTTDTQFRINSTTASAQNGPLTVQNIFGSVNVILGSGTDTFDVEAPSTSANAVTTILGNLNITNGSETNKINNVVIQGNLHVSKAANTFAYSELDMTGTIVDGTTLVQNGSDPSPSGTGGGTTGGDSFTNITNCEFLATAGGTPLSIINGDGNNQTVIQGQTPSASTPVTLNPALTTTQIGSVATAANSLGLSVQNGIGGSNVTLNNITSAPATTPASNPVVYGEVVVLNGETQSLETNGVNFSYSTVYGTTAVENLFGGDTEVFVQSSVLGMQLTTGGLLDVYNIGGSGQNLVYMQGSALPWGLLVDDAGSGSIGNQTYIDSSYVGQTAAGARPLSSNGLPTGDAAEILGGSVLDTVVVRNKSTINGILDLSQLGAGSKQVALDSSVLGGFTLTTASATGTDQLWIGGTTIQDSFNVTLGTADTVYLEKGTTNSSSNSLPTPVTGSFQFSAGAGDNTVLYDSTDALPLLDSNTPGLVTSSQSITEAVAAPWAVLPIPAYPTFPTG